MGLNFSNSLFIIFFHFTSVFSQCFIPSSISSQCLSCDYRYCYKNFSDFWAGGNLSFPNSECSLIDSSSSLELFVSPEPCESYYSLCDGSSDYPFDNIVRAFKHAWRSGSKNITIFLLSNGDSAEYSDQFINRLDFASDFQYIFRRFYADITISPAYC